MITPRGYREMVLEFIDAVYAPGGENHGAADCSGILRRIFRLEFTANDFYERLFIHPEGKIGAAFWLDEYGKAFHVAPLVGDHVVLNLSLDGARLLSIENDCDVVVRYV